MSKIVLSFLTVLFILSSCQNKNNPAISEVDVNGHPMKVINYKMIKDSSAINLSDLARDFDFIPLETTEDCMINRATYFVYNPYILVFQRGKSVLQFDRNGRFLRTLSNYGQGPREFQDFVYCVDENKDILFLGDATRSYIMTWDLNTGDFIKEVRLPYSGKLKRIALKDNGNLLIAPVVGNNEAGGYYFWEQKQDGEVVDKFAAPPVQGWVDSDTELLLYFNGTGYNYLPVKADTIYKIQDHELIPAWFVDFGSRNDEMENQVGHRSFTFLFETKRFFMGSVYTLAKVTMTKYEGGVGYSTSGNRDIVLIDKKSNTLSRSQKIFNDLTNQTLSTGQINVQDNQLVTVYINSLDLIEQNEAVNDILGIDQSVIDRMAKITKSLTPEDNPVLLIGKIK